MTEKHLKETAELALCRALRDMVPTKQGRLDRLFSKLEKETDKILSQKPYVSDADKQRLAEVFDTFRDATGWAGRSKHVLTYVSFLLALIDGRYPGITAPLNGIVDYFERAGRAPSACFWAGAVAKKKWDTIVCRMILS